MLFQTGVGIHIETTFLSMAYLKASIREVRLEAHAVYDLPAEKSLEERLGVARDLMLAFLRSNHILSTDIYLSIPGDMALIRQIQLPLAVKENLRDTLGYEMEKYTPFPVEDVHFDYQIISEDKGTGILNVLLVVVEKNVIASYINLCEAIGVGISGMEISATALANYLFHTETLAPGGSSTAVYMGGGRVEIDLFRDDLLWYSRHGSMVDDRDDLSAVIKREMASLGDTLNDGEGKRPVIFLGPPSDGGLLNIFADDDPFEMQIFDLVKGRVPTYELVPAYGCALKAIRRVHMDINLLPVERRKKPDKRGHYTMMILGGLLALSLISWGGGTIMRERLDLKRLDARIEQLRGEVSKVEKVRDRCNKLEKQINDLNTLSADVHVPILDILADLTDIIPETAWVSNVTISDGEVKIDGYADSASELVTLLEGSPLFKDVAFLSTITKTRDGKERFRIGLQTRKNKP